MPIRSEAQRAKLQALVAEGKMTDEQLAKWETETPKGPLPPRIHPAHHTDPGKTLKAPLGMMAAKSYTRKRFGL